ncbi:terminase small subunit, partial [Escherichia sp. HC-CC]
MSIRRISFGASIRTIQNWQEQGMPVLRGGGKG